MKKSSQLFAIAFAFSLMTISCRNGKNITKDDYQIDKYIVSSNCVSSINYNYDKAPLAQPLYQLSLDSILKAKFSIESLNAANAIGALDLLSQYVNLKQKVEDNATIEEKFAIIELSHKITKKIDLASLEISAFASELDCEEERISQVANYLSNKFQDKETKLTVAAIAAGALGTVSGMVALLNEDDNPTWEYISLGTGVAELGLGGMILFGQKRTHTYFYHKRNALRDIWEDKERSEIFPPSIWYYIKHNTSNDPTNLPLRNEILDRWLSFKQIDIAKTKTRRKLINLYFGNGGKYTIEQLYNRASMYDQLESSVKLIKQDLMLLAIEFGKLN